MVGRVSCIECGQSASVSGGLNFGNLYIQSNIELFVMSRELQSTAQYSNGLC